MFPASPWTGEPLGGVALAVLLLLVGYLLILEPRLGERYYQALRQASGDPRASRERWFAGLTLMQGAFVVVTAALVWMLPEITWDRVGVQWGVRPSPILLGVMGGAVAGMLLGAGAAWRASSSPGGSGAGIPGDLAFFQPRNRADRGWLAVIALGAGTSEEFLYRGLLPALLVGAGTPVVGAVVVQAALFGLAHRYQGSTGVVSTGVLGLLLGGLAAGTGSLLLPVLLHTVLDLRLVLLPSASAGGEPPLTPPG